jgi:hypothetical protein
MRATWLPEIPDSTELDPQEQQVASSEIKDQCGEQVYQSEGFHMWVDLWWSD